MARLHQDRLPGFEPLWPQSSCDLKALLIQDIRRRREEAPTDRPTSGSADDMAAAARATVSDRNASLLVTSGRARFDASGGRDSGGSLPTTT